ncbi:MAG: 30S ribosomal protein S8 [bacterium]
MTMVDPVSDLLTRLRNCNMRRQESFEVPASGLKEEILRLLKEEGYIRNFVQRKRKTFLYYKVFLHYTPQGEKAFLNLNRVSRPGRRVYVPRKKLPIVARGAGTAIVSTSKGVLTSRQAWKAGVGGEVLCTIW